MNESFHFVLPLPNVVLERIGYFWVLGRVPGTRVRNETNSYNFNFKLSRFLFLTFQFLRFLVAAWATWRNKKASLQRRQHPFD